MRRGLGQTKMSSLVVWAVQSPRRAVAECWVDCSRVHQIRGPATEKLPLPNRVLILGTVQTLALAERRWQRTGSLVTSWNSSARYGRVWSRSDLNTRTANLYSTRRNSGSQWSCFKTGETWSPRSWQETVSIRD